MATQTFTVASYLADSASWPYPSGDIIRIVDTSANLAGLSASDIAGFGTNNVDLVNASDDVLSWDVSQWQAVPSGLSFDVDDLKIVYDTGAHIAGLSTGDLADLNSYGVTQINPSDGALDITADQYGALGGISIDQSSDVTLVDTGANISALSAADFTIMSIKGIDVIDASDDAFNLTVGQALGLGSVTIDGSDTVTLADTGAHLAALTTDQIGALGAAGVSIIDATDNVLSITVAQGFAGFTAGMQLTDADTVTVYDTGANISAVDASDMANLGADGFDIIDASDDAYSVTVAQANALYGSGVSLASNDVVTVADTGGNLGELSAATLGNLGEFGIDKLDATDNAVSFDISQLTAIENAGITLAANDVVTLSDSGSNIGELSTLQYSQFAALGVDVIDASDSTGYSTDVAQHDIVADAGMHFAADDTVTLADSGANIGELSVSDIAALAGLGYDSIDATDDALTLNVAQALALGEVGLTGADTVTLADTGANLAALTVEQISALGAAGVDIIDATDNVLSITVAQGFAGFYAGMQLTDGDTVTVYDTGANIAAVSASDMANLGADGFDILDASDNKLLVKADQALALLGSGVELTAGDVVTLKDGESKIEALSASDLYNLGQFGFDYIDSANNVLHLTVAQAEALGTLVGELGPIHQNSPITGGGAVIVAGDDATVLDTSANIQAMTSNQIAALAGAGFDHIDASDDVLALTAAQYTALGTVTLTGADTVTLSDTGANIQGLTAGQFSLLAAGGVDKIDATDNVLALTVAQYNGLLGVKLTGADTVTIRDTGANLATLDFSTLAAAKIDAIDATDNVLNLSVAQFNQLGTVSLAAGDTVTLTDTSANIQALTNSQLLALGAKGVDAIDATDNVLSLTLTQFNNLGSVVLTAADVVTVTATGSQIASLGTSKLAQMNAAHVDVLDATDGAASVSIAQLDAMGSIKFVSNDTITLYDSDANLSAMSAGYIAGLAARGVDTINSSDDTLHLTAAQLAALGTVTLDGHGLTSGPIHLDSPVSGAGPDYITELDTGSLIAAQSTAVLAGLYGLGVDQIDASDDILNLSVAKFLALNVYYSPTVGPIHTDYVSPTSIVLTGGDTVTLVDTGANLAALTVDQISHLSDQQVDFLDSTTDLLNLNVAQFQALGEVGLTNADVVTIKDTGAHLHALTAGDVSNMVADGVDRLDATDNAVTFTKSIVDALISGNIALTSTDTVTMRSGEGTLESLSAGNLATYAAKGIDVIESNSGYLSLDAAQVSAMANTGMKAASGNDVTLRDSGADVLANLGALFGNLASTGIDHIDLTDNAINITVDQALALGTVNFDSSDTGVTILDTSEAIEALTGAQIAALGSDWLTGPTPSGTGVDIIDSTDDVLTVNLDQVQGAYSGGISFAEADVVTLADVGSSLTADISGESFLILAAMGIDILDATDNVGTLNVDQLNGLWESGITIAADDVLTLADTGKHLSKLSVKDIGGLVSTGIDVLNVTDDKITLSQGQFNAFGANGFSFGAEDVVTVNGSNGDNTLTGHAEHDVFYGKGGNDLLDGGAGADTLIGGAGSDTLIGGGGQDVFKFTDITDSVVGAADRIVDLTNADKIDLSGIDADIGADGDQAFHIVDHFTGAAGELMIKYNAGADLTVIKLDVDGDGNADSQIAIVGDHHDFTNFVL